MLVIRNVQRSKPPVRQPFDQPFAELGDRAATLSAIAPTMSW